MPAVEMTETGLTEFIKAVLDPMLGEIREASIAKSKEAKADPIKALVEQEEIKAEEKDKIIDELGGEAKYMQAQFDKEEMSIKAARFIRYLAVGKSNYKRVLSMANEIGDDHVIKSIKAMGEELLSEGGALVPSQYANEMVPYLRARAVVAQLGTVVMPMVNGSMEIAYMEAGANFHWVGENKNIASSTPETGALKLREKKGSAIVPLSNDLINHSSPAADTVVRNDLAGAAGEGIDAAYIRGLGTEYTPKGLLYLVHPDHKFPATSAGASSTIGEISSDIVKLCRLVEDAKIVIRNGAFLLSPQCKWHLLGLQTTAGNYIYKDEMNGGTLFGFKWASTPSIPSNLGSGSNESEVYFGDFSRIVIGDGRKLEIKAFDGGAYHDGTQIISGISTDQTVLRMIIGTDILARQRGKELSVLTAVKWF